MQNATQPVADESGNDDIVIISTPRSIRDIEADLSKPIAARHLKTRKQGGTDITFIEWHVASRYLSHHAPNWSYAIKSVSQVGNLVVVVASISIPALEGVITREATGCEPADSKGWGDPVSSASAMALKRCAALFGLGLYLYSK